MALQEPSSDLQILRVLLPDVLYDLRETPDSEARVDHLINVIAEPIEFRDAPVFSSKRCACIKKSEKPSRVTYWTIRLR